MKTMLMALAVLCWAQVAAQEAAPSFFLARTTGRLAFLEYGLGDDRLGGAKMTYLDSNIVLKVIDSFWH